MLTPREASDRKEILSGEYSNLSEKLLNIQKQRPKLWMDMYAELRKVNLTNRAWEASEMGIEESTLKTRMTAIKVQISAMNTIVNVAHDEARNLY